MSATHHLDPATLAAFASGTLDEAFTLVCAAHVALCAQCRADLHALETLGGAMLDAVEPMPLSAGFAAVSRRLNGPGAASGPEPGALTSTRPGPAIPTGPAGSGGGGDVPAPLRPHLGEELSALPWRSVAPGVAKYAIKLPPSCPSALFLLKVAPGKVLPEHGHGGAELTLVLTGSYRDQFGRFGRGDVADLDEDVEHRLTVDSDEPCICLSATEKPTRFKGLISRLLQPFTGI